MIREGDKKCPYCGGELLYFDTVNRYYLVERRKRESVGIKRYRCVDCKRVHRRIPDYIYPYKHYVRRIIDGFRNSTYSKCDLEFEDYPSDITVIRWNKC